MHVLNQRHGHHLAHEVEQAKIRCSQLSGDTTIDVACIAAGLSTPLRVSDLYEHLASLLARVVACAHECVQEAATTVVQLTSYSNPRLQRTSAPQQQRKT